MTPLVAIVAARVVSEGILTWKKKKQDRLIVQRDKQERKVGEKKEVVVEEKVIYSADGGRAKKFQQGCSFPRLRSGLAGGAFCGWNFCVALGAITLTRENPGERTFGAKQGLSDLAKLVRAGNKQLIDSCIRQRRSTTSCST